MSICFVICYFGKLPIWFDAFMLSCQKNKTINWLIFTDAPVPKFHPDNITFKYLDLKEFNVLAKVATTKNINIEMPYKLCDFKPLYGDIFKNYLQKYIYWGHCDLDLIWGDLVDFFNSIDYQKYDMVSTRKNAISGHCTIYKNNQSLRELYKEINHYWKPLLDKPYAGFDEGYFSYYVYTLFEETDRLKIYWKKDLAIERYTLRQKPLGWFWETGKIFDQQNKEHVYLHFMNWKRNIHQIDFTYADQSKRFYICRKGMFTQKTKATFNLVNYPIKTPFYILKHFIKKLLKKRPQKLANYHPDYLVIEDKYTT